MSNEALKTNPISSLSVISTSVSAVFKHISLFSITHIYNKGTLFGLFKNASWFFIIFAGIVSAYLIVKYASFPKKYLPVAGLILAGAIGNLVDRFWYGAVLDFFDVHFWPVFNVADAAISVAVVVLLVMEYWPKRNI